jgi:hypothetical protein
MDEFMPRADHEPAHIFPLKFWTDYEGTDGEDLAAIEWVQWTKKGTTNATITEDKVRRVMKDPAKWNVLQPYYDAWKRQEKAPVNGYPIDAWPGVTPEQSRVLKDRHVLSVEDLANSSQADLGKLGLPGILQLQGKAKAFLEARQNTAPVAAEVAALREENKTMREELEAAMQLLKEMSDKGEGPRRGRPPKDSE